MGQERVLLGFIEAMDLVHEEDGASSVIGAPFFGFGDHGAQIFDPAHHRRDALEISVDRGGQKSCESGLACAGGAPENHGGDLTPLNHMSEPFARA